MARGVINVPLGSTAAARISGFYTSQDGAIPYVNRGGHDWNSDRIPDDHVMLPMQTLDAEDADRANRAAVLASWEDM